MLLPPPGLLTTLSVDGMSLFCDDDALDGARGLVVAAAGGWADDELDVLLRRPRLGGRGRTERSECRCGDDTF